MQIASTADKLADDGFRSSISLMLTALRKSVEHFMSDTQEMPATIAKRYGLKVHDAFTWYRNVKITAAPTISEVNTLSLKPPSLPASPCLSLPLPALSGAQFRPSAPA